MKHVKKEKIRWWNKMSDPARLKHAIKVSTAVRAAATTGLLNVGAAYTAGQPLKNSIVAMAIGVAGTVLGKTLDEDMMGELNSPPQTTPPPAPPAPPVKPTA